MVLPCFGGDRYWPLTGNVGLLRAPLAAVAGRMVTLGRRSPWSTAEFGDLDGALTALAPFQFGAKQARLAIRTAGSEWVAVLDSAFPGGDIKGFMSDRAQRDLHCEFVAVKWSPNSHKTLPGASFVHYVPTNSRLSTFRGPTRPDQRWVQASDQDGRWEFDTSGDPRSFEELDRYQARRKAERLPLELLGRYLAALGVPVDKDGWLGGPVIVATRVPFGGDGREWSSMVELRRLCGYPEDRIPTDLVRF